MTADTRVGDDTQKRHNERWTQGPIDPMEAEAETLLKKLGLAFTRPDRDPADPANLDFFVPAWNSYVEVKRYHTPRIVNQLALVPKDRGAVVLQGRAALVLLTAIAERDREVERKQVMLHQWEQFEARAVVRADAAEARVRVLGEAQPIEFAKGAKEGWMRCGVYHIDIDFEGRATEHEEVARRWPLAALSDTPKEEPSDAAPEVKS